MINVNFLNMLLTKCYSVSNPLYSAKQYTSSLYIQCPPLILALSVNISKGGSENKSALLIFLIFHLKKITKMLTFHSSKTIESGEKIS